MPKKTFLAVDLGASSGRVMACEFDGAKLALAQVNRFQNYPVELLGSLHWDVASLFNGAKEGIAKASACGDYSVASVGVDTWGVDYGLLDRDGRLLGLPYMYRDSRNDGACERFCAKYGKRKLYDETGIQFIDFNTLFQLSVEAAKPDSMLPKADRLLLIPDLMNYFLSGVKANESTIASTGQMLSLATKGWDWDALDAAGAPRKLFGDIVRPGTEIGGIRCIPGANFPVVAVGSHDTASAVASIPAPRGEAWGYLATGTWALMGVEIDKPIITDDSFNLSYTHEGGTAGDYRFLKNITGMWIVQELRRAWKEEGKDVDFETLMRMAEASKPFASLIDPDFPEFAAPGDMPRKVADYCRSTGQPAPDGYGAFIRAAYEGMALRYREVWGQLERLTGVKRAGLNMIGGATKDKLHCQMVADALGVPVTCGPVEGAAMGNTLAQMMASGDIASLAEGREIVRASTEITMYEPKDTAPWDEAFGRWLKIARGAQ